VNYPSFYPSDDEDVVASEKTFRRMKPAEEGHVALSKLRQLAERGLLMTTHSLVSDCHQGVRAWRDRIVLKTYDCDMIVNISVLRVSDSAQNQRKCRNKAASPIVLSLLMNKVRP
jgi:hypothetical protein